MLHNVGKRGLISEATEVVLYNPMWIYTRERQYKIRLSQIILFN
jgi:hypothetical protein